MSGPNDDQGLIEACRAGQAEAFGVLVRRYQDRLHPTLLRLTGRAEDADDLMQGALNDLAPDHRAVVILKDFDGHRYEEIAEILGIPVGTVRSRLHRARGELRERLKDLFQEEPARMGLRDRS